MNKEIKLNSIEGGPFTSSQNRVTFEIPSDGVYDLSRSYINVNAEINVVENNTTGGIGIYPVDLEYNINATNPPQLTNSALVKNCFIRSARNGMIENLRRSDQLSVILKTLNSSSIQKDSVSYSSLSQGVGPINSQQYSIYRDINKLGTVKSKQNNIAPIKIMLSDLFDFCAQSIELDTQKSGTVTIHCELNVDILKGVQRMKSDIWSDGPKEEYAEVNAEGNANTIQSTIKYTNLDQSPLYVGQKLLLSATGGGGAANVTDEPVVIDEIVWNDDGTLSVSFEQNWGTLTAGQSYTDIRVATADLSDPEITVNLNFAELVLNKLAKMKSDFDKIEYATYSTEETNGNGLTNYQNQFQIEPDSDCVIVGFPEDDADQISANEHLQEYRLRVDNVDLTDRVVEIDSPLHYDRLSMSMSQIGMRLRDLSQNVRNTSTSNSFDARLDGNTETNVIMAPVQQKLQTKNFQLNLTATGAGIKKIVLFKHLPRQFTY